MSHTPTRLVAGFLLFTLGGGAPALAGALSTIGVAAAEGAHGQAEMTPSAARLRSATIGNYLFPPSPNKAGDEVMVVQWCDEAADMQAVVDRHASVGQDAANALYLELVARERCHWIPAALPTTGTLIEEHGFAFVMIPVPVIEQEERAVVEVWSAALDGIEDRAVYITLAHFVLGEREALGVLREPEALGVLREREALDGRRTRRCVIALSSPAI